MKNMTNWTAFSSFFAWLVTVAVYPTMLEAQPTNVSGQPHFGLPFDAHVTARNVRKANSAALFVSEYGSNETVVLDKNGVILQRIHARGILATDREGNLYIADPWDFAVSVSIYAPPYNGTPTLVTPGHGQQINAVIVDHKTDIFAIITQPDSSGGGPGELRFYRHGETVPCRTIPPQNIAPTFYFMGAFDAQDNFFFAVGTNSGDTVASTPGDCGKGALQVYSFGNTIEPYGNVAFDSHNNFVIQAFVNDQPGPLFTYGHPVNGSFGQPLSETPLPSYNGRGSLFLTMDSSGSHVWGSFLQDAIKLYNYPTGGHAIESIRGVTYVDEMAVYPNYVP